MLIFLNAAWRGITLKNIKKSWSTLWPELSLQWNQDDMIPLEQLRQQIHFDPSHADLNRIREIICILDPNGNTSVTEINEWATGQNEHSYDFSDQDIIQSALQTVQHFDEGGGNRLLEAFSGLNKMNHLQQTSFFLKGLRTKLRKCCNQKSTHFAVL